jgi:hypothetical protein
MSEEKDLKTQKRFLEERCFLDKKFGLGWIRKPDFDHKLVTRRQFMSHAIQATAAYAVLPSILSLASRRIYAEELCPTSSLEGKELKILYIDVHGGLPFSWDIVHGGPGGQFDFLEGPDAYYRHGLFTGTSSYNSPGTRPGTSTANENAAVRNAIRKDLGLAFHPNSSLYEGIVNRVPVATRAFIDGAFFPCRSQSDTPNNELASNLAMVHFGFKGSLAGSIGRYRHATMRNSPAGVPGNLRVQSISQARSLSGQSDLQRIFSGTTADPDRGKRAAEKTLQAARQMSESALAEFSNLDFNKQVEILVRCGIIDSVSRPARFDPNLVMPENPASDADLRAAFGFDNQDDVNGVNGFNRLPAHMRETAIACRVLYGGYTGVAGVEEGDGDCHAGRDPNAPSLVLRRIGDMVGAAIRYFDLRNASNGTNPDQSLMIILSTDGSMAGSGRPYTFTANGTTMEKNGAGGDMDESGVAALFYSPRIQKTVDASGNIRSNLFRTDSAVSPGAVPKRQLGYYGNNGNVVANSSVFWDTPSHCAAFLAMNTLALYGRESEYTEATAGRSLFNSNDQLNAHLLFNNLFGS